MTYPPTAPDVRVTGRRVVATLVDGIVLSFLNGVLASLLGSESTSSAFDLTRLSVAGSAWLLLAVVLYYVLLEGLTGRTAGKVVTGIRVVDARTGGRPGILAALVRTLLRFIDGLFGYLVGLVVVLNSTGRRRLGDMAARTLVVRA
jgi:uncharacterized RDD family membrane protein YckC